MKFILKLGLCMLCTLSCQGEENVHHSEIQKNGIKFEMWVDHFNNGPASPKITCAITNLFPKPYYVEINSAAGVPPLYLTVREQNGAIASLREAFAETANFVKPGFSMMASDRNRLLQNESMIVQVQLASHFSVTSWDNAEVTAVWKNSFTEEVLADALELKIYMPKSPFTRLSSTDKPKTFTPLELVNREDSLLENESESKLVPPAIAHGTNIPGRVTYPNAAHETNGDTNNLHLLESTSTSALGVLIFVSVLFVMIWFFKINKKHPGK